MAFRSSHSSITQKLTRMNMLVSGVALVLACSAFFAYDAYNFQSNIIANLSIQAQIIGSNTTSALLFNDPRSAEHTLSALRTARHIISAEIYTPNREAFAGYLRDPKVPALGLPAIPSGQTQMYRVEKDRITQVSPIILQGKTIGLVYLQSDLLALYARLENYALIAMAVFLLSLVAALSISKMSQRAISMPVIRLAEVARAISRDKDYSIRVSSIANRGELSQLIDAFNEMLVQIQERDTALLAARQHLEHGIQERTAQLAAANKELEAFSYSVAHDLRAPLRSIDGFSQALLEDYGEKLDADGHGHLQRVRKATQRMSGLIDDLLNLSRLTRSEMRKEDLDLSEIAKSVAAELKRTAPERPVEFVIEEDVFVKGDSRLLRVVIENLLGNAWKYTTRHERARIEFGKSKNGNGRAPCFVRDDGAGFDPRYAARLFGAFQRLHSAAEFPGTGVGLATVQRIIHRHGGEIWAEAALEKGATFFFTLSQEEMNANDLFSGR